nr:MAG TPA: Protein of unknown function (DUF2591) [Caudoviricetes sp.]
MSTDYRKMSDFEINGLIAKRTQNVGDFTQARGLTFVHEYGNPVANFAALCLGWKEFDPCNNPADAWPIIVDNGISLECIVINRHEKTWRAQFKPAYVKYHMNDKNPLRAAMIVFLMMQEEK